MLLTRPVAYKSAIFLFFVKFIFNRVRESDYIETECITQVCTHLALKNKKCKERIPH